MIYITGDTHGKFNRVISFCERMQTSKDDILIILGDAGINFYLNKRDKKLKECLKDLPITLFSIHGNHEARPNTILSYKLKDFCGGKVWVEDEYPNLLFAKDGEIYDFIVEGNIVKTLVIGGAYSVDKSFRLLNHYPWFSDEQPNDEIKEYVEKQIELNNNKVDVVLSHTCPLMYEPREWFLPFIVQGLVDKSTELWLNKIHEKLGYKKWYCGHYHGSKKIDKLQFMFEDFDVFNN